MAPAMLPAHPQRCSGGPPISVLPQASLRSLANSRFHHTPDPAYAPNSKLEAAYYKADHAIQNIVDLLAAA
jgi:hypothetical protein